jgi:hypothetical protein
MSQIVFKRKVTLIGGKWASKRNMNRIVVRSSELCTHHHHPKIDNKTYYELWRLVKEKKGYIFREITHGGGISGHHKTVKRAVLSACGFSHMTVMLEDTKPQA